MATVSGRIVFDRDRSATINAGDSGIANVPVVLQNTTTNVGLVVLTDANGNYSFINVPNGSYRIVEAFGTPGGVATPGDFNTAVLLPFAIGANPPIGFATNPPIGSTNLDSLTPDTLLVTVAGADLINQNFLNGPVIYTPIQTILDPCVTVSNINLIDAANDGTFGFFPQGTPANTGVPVEPYPGVTPDFTYVLPNPAVFTPLDGEYTVQNIMTDAMSNTIGAWWRIADHTVGNETGRMMVVNGFEPGSVFFRDVVVVNPNTNYLFSSWILNLFKVTGYPDPALGVRIFGENGDILFSATLGALIPVNTNAPEWKEIGTVINSGDNTNITVEFLSEGPAVIGNDYAIDDISLREIQVPEFIPVKTVSPQVASVGDIVTFTVTIRNTCTSPLTDVSFSDIVPNGLEFLPGTVTINAAPNLTADPNNGFTLPDIPGGATTTVIFDAIVTNIPTPNPTPNTATITYSYTPVEGGVPTANTVDSNTVLIQIAESADISVEKIATPSPVEAGQLLNYTIVVSNSGPSDAQNVILTDSIPPSIIGAEFSVNGGATYNPWPGLFNIGTLPTGSTRTILIRGTVSPAATGTITNVANVTSTTPDPDPTNNTFTVSTEVTQALAEADVSVIKIANPSPVAPGGVLTYTIQVSNAGPDDAGNVILTDSIPVSIIGPEFSTNGGINFSLWTGFFNIGTLTAGSTRTIIIRGTVSPSASGIITNTANVTSTTPDPNPLNNTFTVNTQVTGTQAGADISVIKTSSPNPVTQGEMLTYTLVVSNAGPAQAENVVLTDNVSPNIIGAEFSVDLGVTFNPWPGSINIGALPAGSTRTILIRGTVSSLARGCIANAANVTSTTPDPNLLNNTSSICVEIKKVADIAVKKKCSICEHGLKTIVVFRIKVSNFGPSTAENVILEDKIPNGIFDVKFSIQGTAVHEPWTGSLNIGDLEAGRSIIVILEGILRTNCKKKICNTARVTSTTFDPDLTNNRLSVCIKAMRYNNRRGCCEDFECFECNECEEFMEDRNCNWTRDDF